MANEVLVQLDSRCPACERTESRRIAAWRIELYRAVSPDRICETVTCKCGRVYTISAAAYQGAA